MLAPLDNEKVFKKAFTDKIVFTQFVKDILEVDIDVDKIETEKQFKPKAMFIDLKLDIFAQSKDKRIIIEIQRVEYDYHFDRFQNYFLSTIVEQQKSAKKYKVDQTVYSIVVLTTPYTINQRTGEPIENEVLIQNIDPETLEGKKIKVSGHTQIFLNPHYRKATTPKRILDWLDFIYASIKSPEEYTINLKNKGIKRAKELIDVENMDDESRRQIKISNETKALHTILKNKGRSEEKIEIAKNCYGKRLSIQDTAEITGLSVEQVKKIYNELKNSH